MYLTWPMGLYLQLPPKNPKQTNKQTPKHPQQTNNTKTVTLCKNSLLDCLRYRNNFLVVNSSEKNRLITSRRFDQGLPTYILPKTTGVCWSKRRVVSNWFFSELLLLKNEFLYRKQSLLNIKPKKHFKKHTETKSKNKDKNILKKVQLSICESRRFDQGLPTYILPKTTRVCWSKRRVVSNWFFSELLLLKNEFLYRKQSLLNIKPKKHFKKHTETKSKNKDILKKVQLSMWKWTQ